MICLIESGQVANPSSQHLSLSKVNSRKAIVVFINKTIINEVTPLNEVKLYSLNKDNTSPSDRVQVPDTGGISS